MNTTHKQLSALLAVGLIAAGSELNAQAFAFADIPVENTVTVGTGANSSGLVIDFNSVAGVSDRFVFEYQWDGAAGSVSGAQMLDAVATAITGLSYSGTGTVADGLFVQTITIDGFGSSTNEAFNFDPPSQSWAYFIAGGFAGDTIPFAPGGDPVAFAGAADVIPDGDDTTFQSSPTGPSATGFGDLGRTLEDGSWDVYVYGDWNAPTYVVPEPSSYALLAGLLALSWIGIRRRV